MPNAALRGFWQRAFDRFLRIRGEPAEVAAGLALGLFVGLTPFLGLHMAIAVLAAALLKWNKISAAMGVWISNPFTAPLVYGLTYLTGARVLGYEAHYPPPAELSLKVILHLLGNAPEIFMVLFTGGILLGAPLAIGTYFLSFWLLTRYRQRIEPRIRLKKRRRAARTARKKRGLRSRQVATRTPPRYNVGQPSAAPSRSGDSAAPDPRRATGRLNAAGRHAPPGCAP